MTDGGASENCRRARPEPRRRPEQLDQLVVNDLEDRLRRRERLEHVRADRAFLDARDERFGGTERNVGLEQRDANFAQRFVDVAPR